MSSEPSNDIEIPSEILPLMESFGQFIMRCINLRTFLRELEDHTSKLDRTLPLEIGKLRIRIPTFGLPDDDKELLSRLRAGIEQQLADTGIVLLVSILEYSLRDFCNAVKNWKNLNLSWSELRGEPLEQFKTYFQKVADIPLEISPAEWEEFQGLSTLRNAIVHNLGELRELKKEDKARLRRLLDNNDGVSMEDNRVRTSLQFCHVMVDKIQRVLGQPLAKILEAQARRK
jgi:hypothetical protein